MQSVREMVLDGRLGSGQQLDIDSLSRALGVSPRPLRESLLVLEAEGYLTVSPRRGTFVAVITEQDIADRIEVLVIVAGLAARRAASAAATTPSPRTDDLAQAARRTVTAPESTQAWADFFHELAVASGSTRVVQEMDAMTAALASRLVPTASIGTTPASDLALRLADAVSADDGPDAEQKATALVRAAGIRLRAELSEAGLWPAPSP